MKLVDPEETVVLVTGTSPSAEERDRPLAYPTVWICTPDKPLVEIPVGLRGVTC